MGSWDSRGYQYPTTHHLLARLWAGYSRQDHRGRVVEYGAERFPKCVSMAWYFHRFEYPAVYHSLVGSFVEYRGPDVLIRRSGRAKIRDRYSYLAAHRMHFLRREHSTRAVRRPSALPARDI